MTAKKKAQESRQDVESSGDQAEAPSKQQALSDVECAADDLARAHGLFDKPIWGVLKPILVDVFKRLIEGLAGATSQTEGGGEEG